MEKTNKMMYYTSKTSVHLVTDITPVTNRIVKGNIEQNGRIINRYFAKSTLYSSADEALNNFKNKVK